MSRVKDIRLKVIPSRVANNFIKKHHYSGSVVSNSKLHFGAFLDGILHGVMSFGSSLDKRKMLGLVKGTKWNEFIELNRMAFDEVLPKYSESRCISIAMKLLKKQAPHIKWVLSFADGTQCGDGTIYRASGFILTNIKKNNTIWKSPEGKVKTDISLRLGLKSNVVNSTSMTKGKNILDNYQGASSMKMFKDAGWNPISGYQLRYIYFLHSEERNNLTVPEIPFSKIKEMGAAMYLGKNICDSSVNGSTSSVQDESGGSIPTESLYNYA